jgi:hypothetical protein
MDAVGGEHGIQAQRDDSEYGQQQEASTSGDSVLIVHETNDRHAAAAQQKRKIKARLCAGSPQQSENGPNGDRHHDGNPADLRGRSGMRFSLAVGMIDDVEPFTDRPREQADRHRCKNGQVLEKHDRPPKRGGFCGQYVNLAGSEKLHFTPFLKPDNKSMAFGGE